MGVQGGIQPESKQPESSPERREADTNRREHESVASFPLAGTLQCREAFFHVSCLYCVQQCSAYVGHHANHFGFPSSSVNVGQCFRKQILDFSCRSGRRHRIGCARRRVAAIFPSAHTSELRRPLWIRVKCAEAAFYCHRLASLARLRFRPAIMCVHAFTNPPSVATHRRVPFAVILARFRRRTFCPSLVSCGSVRNATSFITRLFRPVPMDTVEIEFSLSTVPKLSLVRFPHPDQTLAVQSVQPAGARRQWFR